MLKVRTTRALSLCLGFLATGCALENDVNDEDVMSMSSEWVNKGTNKLDPAAKGKFPWLYSSMSGPLLAAPVENQVVTTQVAIWYG